MISCPQLLTVKLRRVFWTGTILGLVGWGSVHAQEKSEPLFRDATFEELANIIVSTVSRRAEPISHVSAALTVVTAEDIQRSGAANIPEAMRYVPGLEVAQINAHDWAISARGFNSRFANKQLVLEDGRSIYSPYSGGVYWEAVGPPVAEIEQIEIIRGPGASVWGANAMNGVINIVTKSARETQGDVVSISGGTMDKQSVYSGFGFKAGERTWARVFAEGINGGAAKLANGAQAGDPWEAVRAGIRVDRDLTDSSRLFFQAEISTARLYESGDYPLLTAPYRLKITEASRMTTAHLLSRWTRDYAPDNKLTLQAFWSYEKRTQFRNDFANDTFDLELTQQLAVGDQQQIIWGGGTRLINHALRGNVGVVFPDQTPKDEVVNLFFQDEIQLQPHRLSLTVGSKIEHNNISQLELEPSIRLAWHPTEQQTAWAAISRSVHTPSVLERDIRYDAQVVRISPLTLARQISEGNTQSEVQIAYELGYRFQPATDFSLDATVFYNDLPTVQAFRQGTPFLETAPSPAHIVVPLIFDKTGLKGGSRGVELAARCQATEHWRLFAEYSYLEVKLNTMPGLTSFSSYTPRHRFGLRSSWDLPGNWQWDMGVRYASDRPGTTVPSYFVGDVQLAWRPNANWEFSVTGQNLFESQHAEIPPFALGSTVEIPTTVSAKITWRFM